MDYPVTYFTGRTKEIAAFEALWESPQPWWLVFTGISGSGKSFLLRYLQQEQAPAVPVARYDFEDGFKPERPVGGFFARSVIGSLPYTTSRQAHKPTKRP